MDSERHINNSQGILSMWLIWVASTGALVLVVLLSLWVSPLWMPVIPFGMELLIYSFVRHNREARYPRCYIIPFVTTRILFWTGLIMFAVYWFYRNHFIDHVFDSDGLNYEIPFICVLIEGPVACVVSSWAWFKGYSMPFCRECRMRHGNPSERGFLGILFCQEGHFQTKLLLVLSLIISVSSWIYYLIKYINVNFNSADLFFFFWIPFIFYLMSVAYTAIRYLSMWHYYDQDIVGSAQRHGMSTYLRYILIRDNYIFLRIPDLDSTFDPSMAKADTPAALYMSHRERMTDYEARNLLEGMTGLKDVDLRFMYSNESFNADCNIFHYICILDNESESVLEKRYPDGGWFSIQQINDMIESKSINTLLGAEIHRLYTVAMAWKTYDRNGRRLYKIRHYKPTFRICDIKNWDVDYNDPQWLIVSENNEDKPFYALRRFWRRYINGTK